ncbi:MAG: dihydroneopterin aldolase [Chitinophagaceae bacterium]
MHGHLTISLSNLRFFAYHGLYAEEKKIGNEFEVSLNVSYSPSAETITDISDTINYSQLYELLKLEMQQPRHLLETFVLEVTEKIHVSFRQIKKVEISITKLHPPITKFTGTVGVKYSKEY